MLWSLLFYSLCQSSLFFVVMLRLDETAARSKIHGHKHARSHTGTQSHTHLSLSPPPTGRVSSFAWSCCETRLTGRSVSSCRSHLPSCVSTQQPNASRGVTSTPLFVSQNNIGSTIVFPAPSCSTRRAHSLMDVWNVWPSDFWFQRNAHKLLRDPSRSHCFPHESTDAALKVTDE